MITNTTLCYVDDGTSYLMLHRTKKAGDMNKDKWIGIGGHMEEGESPEDCILREAREETGCRLLGSRLRGIITFCYQDITEYMFLFTASGLEKPAAGQKPAMGQEPAAGQLPAAGHATAAGQMSAAAGRRMSDDRFAKQDVPDSSAAAGPSDAVSRGTRTKDGAAISAAAGTSGSALRPADELPPCDEGDLIWVRKENVPDLNLWEGDRIFLRLLAREEAFFSLKLVYSADDSLCEAVLNGERM